MAPTTEQYFEALASWLDHSAEERLRKDSQNAARKISLSADQRVAEKHFADFWDMTYPGALAHATYRLPTRQVAEDLVHETYVDLWDLLTRRAKAGDDFVIREPRAYLHRAMRHKIAEHYRQQASRPAALSLEDILETQDGNGLPADEKHDAEMLFDDKIERRALNEAFRSLDAEKKELLLLRYRSELTLREIAESLDMNVSTVKTKLRRAVDELERLIN